jgi:hypothetical protein
VSISVRPADPSDVPWLLTQLPELDAFYGSDRSLLPHPDYAEDWLRERIAEGPFFVADDVKGPVGFIVGVLGAHSFKPDVAYVINQIWWVVEKARGSRAGGLLLAALVAYGERHSARVYLAIQPQTPIDREHLRRRGFVERDTTYELVR